MVASSKRCMEVSRWRSEEDKVVLRGLERNLVARAAMLIRGCLLETRKTFSSTTDCRLRFCGSIVVSKTVSDGQESVSVAGKSRSQAGGSGGDGRLALVGWASEFRAPSLWGSFEMV